MSILLDKIQSTFASFATVAWKTLFSLIPRNRRFIVFGAWAGKKYDDNARALFEYCLAERPDLTCVWHTRNPEVEAEMRREGLPVCNIRSFQAFADICRARYIVHTDSPLDFGWSAFTGGARIINLWHGVGPKRFGYDIKKSPTPFGEFLIHLEQRVGRHFYFSTSAAISDRYVRAFRSKPDHILDRGQARNDLFYTPHRNPLRDRFPGKKIIVYMPTFREDGKNRLPMDLDTLIDLPALHALCEKAGMVFLVKFHPWTDGHVSDRYPDILELKDSSIRVQMLLDAADILVTDYSSCFVDHLLLDRPQVFFAYDLDHYIAHERNLYGDFRKDATGRICEDQSALLDELMRISEGEDRYAGKRQEIRDFYYSRENQKAVSAKQVDTILQL